MAATTNYLEITTNLVAQALEIYLSQFWRPEFEIKVLAAACSSPKTLG